MQLDDVAADRVGEVAVCQASVCLLSPQHSTTP